MSVLVAHQLTKVFGGARGAVTTRALDAFDLRVDEGEFLSIMDPSESGKTTLLQVVGTLDTPTSGEILLQNKPLTIMKSAGFPDAAGEHHHSAGPGGASRRRN